jgi:hypothetical protein
MSVASRTIPTQQPNSVAAMQHKPDPENFLKSLHRDKNRP